MNLTIKRLFPACLALAALGAAASPTYQNFGTLSQANFGGTGIPNNAVASSTLKPTVDVLGHTIGLGTVTMGLTATARGSSNAAVTNNGQGTFYAGVGVDQSSASSIFQKLATWDLDFYVGGDATALAQYSYRLLIDTDPSSKDSFKTINLSYGLGVQNALNVGFDLDELAYGYQFNPTQGGQYTFELEAVNSKGTVVGMDSIQVDVVPEPASIALVGIALTGLAFASRRRRI